MQTKIDELFSIVEKQKVVLIRDLAKKLSIPASTIMKIGRYLEQLEYVDVDYKHITGPVIIYKHTPDPEFQTLDADELINRLKFYKNVKDTRSANKLLYDLYKFLKNRNDELTNTVYKQVRSYYLKNFMQKLGKNVTDPITKIDTYRVNIDHISVEVDIIRQELEPVPFYIMFLFRMSYITRMVVDKLKEEVVNKLTFNVLYKNKEEERKVKLEYKAHLLIAMKEIFPDIAEEKIQILCDYIVLTSLGMGDIEFLLRDKHLEEIVINNALEPVRVYHKKYGWLETNIILDDEARIMHFATLAGRVVDKTITTLTPLMDGHLETGDRFNATLSPISSKGHTITIRKFAELPWSITDFLNAKTIDFKTVAMLWTAIQFEMSILIVGGTGSGKTSTLNVLSIFIPPNQRVVSIEDTRELRLPKTLHWVPLETRLPNPEGKGEVSMLDLIVNSLRMRPDRIIVGEIRRKKEAEVLFEAMHTGHSVYATLHANTVSQAIIRLTTDPIGVPKSLLGAVDMMLVQNRNRRTGKRRTLQLAEILDNGDHNILYEYDIKSDKLNTINKPKIFYDNLRLFSGLSKNEVDSEINDKIKVLKYFVDNSITDNDQLALLINYYYVNKKYLMKKLFGDKNKRSTK